MARRQQKKPLEKKHHPEAKGLFLLAINLLAILSLISFQQGNVHVNWLGAVGYYFAFFSLYLFGLVSYLLFAALTWVGWKWLIGHKLLYPIFRTTLFSTLVICSCILINIFADVFPEKAQFFAGKIYSETVIVPTPYPYHYTRFNLGGVPFYYLYRDIPFFNLQKMLSTIGSTLIFFLTGFVSFLLLTGTEILPNLQRFIRTLFRGTRALLVFCKRNFSLSFPKKKQKTILSRPSNPSYIPPPSKTISNPEPSLEELAEDPSVKIKTMRSFFSNPSRKQKRKIQSVTTPTHYPRYRIPSPSLLTDPAQIDYPSLKKDLRKQAKILEDTLLSFGIEGKVGEINCGPTITSFEVHPPIGVKVQKIKALEKDIALNLQAKSIRIIAPIPGKAAVGVEIPALHPQEVSFKEMLLHYYNQSKKFHIPLLLGKTVGGEYVQADMTKTPHLLIAGATGSGKSVCINTIVMSILMTARPDQIRLMMIDPKKVELTQYSQLPHMIAPVITEPHGAYAALQWLVKEMQTRYDILKHLSLRNITAFNKRKIHKEKEEEFHLPIPEQMPYFVAIIDEFADLMMVSSSDLETPIARIAQMARAVGIHLVLATQRPSREVITGIIKANFPSRLAFKVASRINSQIILDETGAESLLGNGDMLFLPPGSSQLLRAQGSYISDEDINQCLDAICEQAPPDYLIPSFDAMQRLDSLGDGSKSHRDPLYDQALSIVLETKNASTTYLQRKLKIGYARAASLMDELEDNGIIGPQEGSKPRQVFTPK